MADFDEHCMGYSVIEARRCSIVDSSDPYVGVVAAQNEEILGTAFRGEMKAGEHAEYTLLERKLKSQNLSGCTIYTTLEPCTKRGEGKIPCATRLIDRRVSRVVIGMLDPDQRITGRGILQLRRAGIEVALFPPKLTAALEDLNRDFIRHRISLWEQHEIIPQAGFYVWDSVPGLGFRELLNNADEVWILARSAINLLSRYFSDLKTFLISGGRLNIMIADPASPFCRTVYGSDEKLFTANMNVTTTHLDALRTCAPGQIEIRLFKRPPNYGILLVRGKKVIGNHDAVIQVRHYPEYSSTGRGRPFVALLPTNKIWFRLFEEDLEKIWQGAELEVYKNE